MQQSKVLKSQGKRVNAVCTNVYGKFVTKYSVEENLSKAGLNAHSFRHTHATMLIEGGASPKGVAGRLGHANTSITQNLYTHNTDKIQEDTLKVFVKNLTKKND